MTYKSITSAMRPFNHLDVNLVSDDAIVYYVDINYTLVLVSVYLLLTITFFAVIYLIVYISVYRGFYLNIIAVPGLSVRVYIH